MFKEKKKSKNVSSWSDWAENWPVMPSEGLCCTPDLFCDLEYACFVGVGPV